MSSTVTNHVLTDKSKTETINGQHNLAIGNFLAFIGSLFHASFFLVILNIELFIQILPVIILIILATTMFILFLKGKDDKQSDQTINIPFHENPDIFLLPAVKFALLLTSIKIISGLALIY